MALPRFRSTLVTLALLAALGSSALADAPLQPSVARRPYYIRSGTLVAAGGLLLLGGVVVEIAGLCIAFIHPADVAEPPQGQRIAGIVVANVGGAMLLTGIALVIVGAVRALKGSMTRAPSSLPSLAWAW